MACGVEGLVPDRTPLVSGFLDGGDGDQDSGDPWEGTAFTGELRALITLTFTQDHPLIDGDAVGLAGGYRDEETGWVGAEDLYSAVAYGRAFPSPPDTPDTLVPAELLAPYDYGSPSTWMTAGQGMKIREEPGSLEMSACLLHAGSFPLYRSSSAMGVDPTCASDPAAWLPRATFDVVLYGGELFEDNVLINRVVTPQVLTVSAPDLDDFNAPVSASEDLTITWEPDDDPDGRIIIRIVDSLTNVITVHAADDGSFVIPAAELAALIPGAIDMSITRERLERTQFTDGGLTVLARYERWGFFDLN